VPSFGNVAAVVVPLFAVNGTLTEQFREKRNLLMRNKGEKVTFKKDKGKMLVSR